MNMTRRTKLALVGLAVLALPTLGHAQNLLVYGGFETDNVVPLAGIVNPLQPGLWGVERAVRDTGPTGGVIPYKGNWMLKMDDPGGVVTQAFQFVDISNRGTLNELEVEAWYNSDADAARVNLIVSYYRTNLDWFNEISVDSRAMVLDNDTSTWQGLYYRSDIPGAANWVGFQVSFVNTTIGADSGFVDGASLLLVPEPATMIALGIGLAALAARRRRKQG
ncbi:MAG: PEP-CTERM sorting domain-containing protein [Armatimonadetes bacterium]|nr:PEP-CTERM sorting domain-containing protein [Armatimonadota bacterium]